jgi:hypothetical protein
VATGVGRPVPAAAGDELDVALIALPAAPKGTWVGRDVLEAPGAVAVAVAWAPGWSASVDGLPVPLRDGPFLHAEAPPDAVVTYRYVPAGLATGALLTAIGLAALLITRRRLGTGRPG